MSSFIIKQIDLLGPSLARAGRAAERGERECLRGHPALCFLEDDIRKKFAQEEQWDEMCSDGQKEAIRLLMDANEYARAATVADEAIAEAVGRYLHEAMLAEKEQQEGVAPARQKNRIREHSERTADRS